MHPFSTYICIRANFHHDWIVTNKHNTSISISETFRIKTWTSVHLRFSWFFPYSLFWTFPPTQLKFRWHKRKKDVAKGKAIQIGGSIRALSIRYRWCDRHGEDDEKPRQVSGTSEGSMQSIRLTNPYALFLLLAALELSCSLFRIVFIGRVSCTVLIRQFFQSV